MLVAKRSLHGPCCVISLLLSSPARVRRSCRPHRRTHSGSSSWRLPLPTPNVNSALRLGGWTECYNIEAAQNLFPDSELEKGLKFLEDKEAWYRSLAKECLEPVKGLAKVVQWVKDCGYKRAAVTNAPRINAELMISLLGLSDFFQAVIVGGECEKPKPAPYPYLKALEEP